MEARDKTGVSEEVMIGIRKLIKDGVKVYGHWRTTVFDKDGNIKETDEGVNQVTLVGDAHIADQLSDQGEAQMGWMSVGTTSGGKTEASTQLEAEIDKNAFSAGPTQGAGADDHEVAYQGQFTGNAATLVEWGISNNVAADTGTYLCYAEGSHLMGAGDTLQIDWTLSVAH